MLSIQQHQKKPPLLLLPLSSPTRSSPSLPVSIRAPRHSKLLMRRRSSSRSCSSRRYRRRRRPRSTPRSRPCTSFPPVLVACLEPTRLQLLTRPIPQLLACHEEEKEEETLAATARMRLRRKRERHSARIVTRLRQLLQLTTLSFPPLPLRRYQLRGFTEEMTKSNSSRATNTIIITILAITTIIIQANTNTPAPKLLLLPQMRRRRRRHRGSYSSARLIIIERLRFHVPRRTPYSWRRRTHRPTAAKTIPCCFARTTRCRSASCPSRFVCCAISSVTRALWTRRRRCPSTR